VTGFCGLAAYSDPVLSPDATVHSIDTILPDGSLIFQYQCNRLDSFNFGPGLLDGCLGGVSVVGYGLVRYGVLRAYAGLGEQIGCAGSGFGTNPYRALGAANSGGTFVDTFTLPPTASAPHPGDPTMLSMKIHLDCSTGGSSVSYGICGGLSAQVFTAAAYDAQGYGAQRLGVASVATCNGSYLFNCPLSIEKVFPVPVAEQLLVLGNMNLSAGDNYPGNESNPHSTYIDATNTGTFILTDADGMPVVGDSGHVYADPGSQPPIPTTTTVTTTTVTSTTLPTCAGTCGNEVVQPDCGEACECPPDADPVHAAFGCSGSTVVPGQPDCVVCRGCRLITALCASAPVPTTTSTTTISTTPSTSTTSTTLATACPTTRSVAAIACRLDAFLADVQARGDLGSLQSKLVSRIRQAQVRQSVESLLTKGRKHQAKGVLRAAAKRLKGMGSLFHSHAGRKVPPQTRLDLLGVADAIAADLQAVAASL
jgi:hypothetical protein